MKHLAQYIAFTVFTILSLNTCKKDSKTACQENNTGTLTIVNLQTDALSVALAKANTGIDFTNPLLTFTVEANSAKSVEVTAGTRQIRYATTTGDTSYSFYDLAQCGTTSDTALFFQVSDRRLKTDIRPLANSLQRIMLLQAYNFNYNYPSFPNIALPKGRQNGFMAQDVECIFPELTRTGKNGYSSVNYTGLIPILTKALQQQQEEIELLKQEVEMLKSHKTKGM